MNIFDILNAISFTKEDLSKHSDFDKTYDSFMINRYISMLADTVHYAMFMDANSSIPKKQQFLFYLSAIPQKRRYFKYHKKETIVNKDKVKLLCNYFQVRQEVAIDMIDFFDKKELTEINKLYKNK